MSNEQTKAQKEFNQRMLATPRFRKVVKQVTAARECYAKHGDAGHGFINATEDEINSLANAADFDVLQGVGMIEPRKHGSDRHYISLSNVMVTG